MKQKFSDEVLTWEANGVVIGFDARCIDLLLVA